MALSPEMMKLVSQAKNKYAGNGGKTAKPQEGRNTYRLIQKLFGEDLRFWRDLGVHWIKPALDAKPVAVVGCESIVYDRPSVIATMIDKAIMDAVDEDSKKLYEEWKARKSVLVNVVNRKDDSQEVLELTPTTFGKVLDLVQLYGAEGQDILDHTEGFDIVITKTGKALNTNYDVAIAPTAPGKPHKAITKDQVDRATNLDDFIASNFFRGEEQKALNAIAQISGVNVPNLRALNGTATPTAALSAPSASVQGAAVPNSVMTPVSAPAQPDPLEEARKAKAAQMAELQRQMAALSAEPAPVAPPTTVAADPAPSLTGVLPAAEEEALMRELDGL
jgi:hypothetical protein